MSASLGHLASAARRKVNGPPEWEACSWRCVGETNDVEVKGGVPVGVYKAGPRKGRQKWDSKSLDVCVISPREVEEEIVRYEADGPCADCFGTGRRWAGWDHVEGTKYVDCTRCDSTGKAPGYTGAFVRFGCRS